MHSRFFQNPKDANAYLKNILSNTLKKVKSNWSREFAIWQFMSIILHSTNARIYGGEVRDMIGNYLNDTDDIDIASSDGVLLDIVKQKIKISATDLGYIYVKKIPKGSKLKNISFLGITLMIYLFK